MNDQYPSENPSSPYAEEFTPSDYRGGQKNQTSTSQESIVRGSTSPSAFTQVSRAMDFDLDCDAPPSFKSVSRNGGQYNSPTFSLATAGLKRRREDTSLDEELKKNLAEVQPPPAKLRATAYEEEKGSEDANQMRLQSSLNVTRKPVKSAPPPDTLALETPSLENEMSKFDSSSLSRTVIINAKHNSHATDQHSERSNVSATPMEMSDEINTSANKTTVIVYADDKAERSTEKQSESNKSDSSKPSDTSSVAQNQSSESPCLLRRANTKRSEAPSSPARQILLDKPDLLLPPQRHQAEHLMNYNTLSPSQAEDQQWSLVSTGTSSQSAATFAIPGVPTRPLPLPGSPMGDRHTIQTFGGAEFLEDEEINSQMSDSGFLMTSTPLDVAEMGNSERYGGGGGLIGKINMSVGQQLQKSNSESVDSFLGIGDDDSVLNEDLELEPSQVSVDGGTQKSQRGGDPESHSTRESLVVDLVMDSEFSPLIIPNECDAPPFSTSKHDEDERDDHGAAFEVSDSWECEVVVTQYSDDGPNASGQSSTIRRPPRAKSLRSQIIEDSETDSSQSNHDNTTHIVHDSEELDDTVVPASLPSFLGPSVKSWTHRLNQLRRTYSDGVGGIEQTSSTQPIAAKPNTTSAFVTQVASKQGLAHRTNAYKSTTVGIHDEKENEVTQTPSHQRPRLQKYPSEPSTTRVGGGLTTPLATTVLVESSQNSPSVLSPSDSSGKGGSSNHVDITQSDGDEDFQAESVPKNLTQHLKPDSRRMSSVRDKGGSQSMSSALSSPVSYFTCDSISPTKRD
jgi:hypothetical protein